MKASLEEPEQMPEQTDLNVLAPKTEKRAVYIDIYLADKYLFIRKISWKSAVKHVIIQLSWIKERYSLWEKIPNIIKKRKKNRH